MTQNVKKLVSSVIRTGTFLKQLFSISKIRFSVLVVHVMFVLKYRFDTYYLCANQDYFHVMLVKR